METCEVVDSPRVRLVGPPASYPATNHVSLDISRAHMATNQATDLDGLGLCGYESHTVGSL